MAGRKKNSYEYEISYLINEFHVDELFQETFVDRDFLQGLLLENPLDQVGLFVIEGTQDDVEGHVSHGHQLPGFVLLKQIKRPGRYKTVFRSRENATFILSVSGTDLNAGRVEDGSEVLADVEVGSLVLVQLDHVLVELELERLLFLLLEEADVDLLGDDLGPDVVLGCQAEAHLLQDQLHLLLALHGAIGFNLTIKIQI